LPSINIKLSPDVKSPSRRPVIVGQAPGARAIRSPLSGLSGRRLATFAGLDLADFLVAFERVNLIEAFPGKAGKGDAFPIAVARAAWAELRPRLAGRDVILLGRGVARAASHKAPPFAWLVYADKTRIALCPHPSGVNRWWNVAPHGRAARRFWRDLAQARLRRRRARRRPRRRRRASSKAARRDPSAPTAAHRSR
jgi:uracil-DNA glycosylase